MRHRDRVWLAILLIHFVSCAARGQQFGGSGLVLGTKPCVVVSPENVVIFHDSDDLEFSAPALQGFDARLRERDDIVWVFGDISGSQRHLAVKWRPHRARITLFRKFWIGMHVNMQGWRCARVFHDHFYVVRNSGYQRAVLQLDSRQSHPSTELKAPGFYGVNVRPAALERLPCGESCVDNDGDQRQPAYETSPLVVGGILILCGLVLTFYVWWNLDGYFSRYDSLSVPLAGILIGAVFIWIGMACMLSSFHLISLAALHRSTLSA